MVFHSFPIKNGDLPEGRSFPQLKTPIHWGSPGSRDRSQLYRSAAKGKWMQKNYKKLDQEKAEDSHSIWGDYFTGLSKLIIEFD